MLSTIADYQRISKDMVRSLSLTAKKPDARNALNDLPLMGHPQEPPERSKLAVDRCG